jgi:DNA-binding CsgD family transcriptional regulator
VEHSRVEEYRSGDALFVVDEELRIAWWNGEAERLTGIAAEAAVGNHCWSVLAGLDLNGGVVCNAGCPAARAAFQQGDVSARPLVIRTTSGRRRVTVSTLTVGTAGARRLVHLLQPAPGSPRRPPPPEVLQLTGREREVLELLRAGRSASGIALELGVSVPTVRTHIHHILTALDAHSQLAAVARASRPGP